METQRDCRGKVGASGNYLISTSGHYQATWPLSSLQVAPGGPNALGVRYIEILFSQRRVRFGVSLYLVLSLANLSGLPAVSQAQCQSWGTNVRMLVAIPK